MRITHHPHENHLRIMRTQFLMRKKIPPMGSSWWKKIPPMQIFWTYLFLIVGACCAISLLDVCCCVSHTSMCLAVALRVTLHPRSALPWPTHSGVYFMSNAGQHCRYLLASMGSYIRGGVIYFIFKRSLISCVKYYFIRHHTSMGAAARTQHPNCTDSRSPH